MHEYGVLRRPNGQLSDLPYNLVVLSDRASRGESAGRRWWLCCMLLGETNLRRGLKVMMNRRGDSHGRVLMIVICDPMGVFIIH